MEDKRENNNRAFVELEYCLDQYFSQHYAPIVNKEYKDLKTKQLAEYGKTLDKNPSVPGVFGGGASTALTAYTETKTVGEWGTKNMDYLLEQCSTKFFSDRKVQADLINLKACCQAVFLKRLGVDGYNKLAEEFGAPPEDIYVAHRFQSLLMEHLARKDMPKNSLEYVMKKGFEDSLPGYILSLGRKSSDKDNEVSKLSEKLYNPSKMEKVTAFGVSFVLDSATIGGYGSAKKAATGLAWDASIRAAQPAIIKKLGKLAGLAGEKMTVDEKFSMELTGNKSFLDYARRSAKNVNPDRSDNVTHLNSVLNKKMFRPQFDYQEYKKTASALRVKFNEAGDGYVNIASGIASGLSSMGISINKNKDIPKWMEGKTDEECFSLATAFAAKAMEMKSRGIHELVGKGKRETLEECAQKAYDYARVLQASQRRKTEESAVVSPAGQSSQQTQQQTVMHQASMQQYQQQGNQSVGGWGSLAGQSGQTLSDFLGNGGKMLSMLPSLLSGMFTGKNGGLRFSDNLFSVGCILVGIFTKNKLMKMLFLALAGGNLLSKALGGGSGVGSSRSRPVRYREYGDEPLDPRISKPVLRGRTLVADIDGVPSVITINDEPVDAYEKGKLPLNTLANAVLRKYDEQRQAVEENYSRHVAENVSEDRSVALR